MHKKKKNRAQQMGAKKKGRAEYSVSAREKKIILEHSRASAHEQELHCKVRREDTEQQKDGRKESLGGGLLANITMMKSAVSQSDSRPTPTHFRFHFRHSALRLEANQDIYWPKGAGASLKKGRDDMISCMCGCRSMVRWHFACNGA